MDFNIITIRKNTSFDIKNNFKLEWNNTTSLTYQNVFSMFVLFSYNFNFLNNGFI